MSVAGLLRRDCTVTIQLNSGAVDEYGNDLDQTTSLAMQCDVQQRRTQEATGGGELSLAEWMGYFPAGAPLDVRSVVDVADLGVFALEGAPWPVRNPRTGVDSHIEARLNLTAGAEDRS